MKKKMKKKWFIIIGAVVVVIILVVLNLGQSNRGVVSVQTKKVTIGDVTSIVSGSGTVQPKTKVNITSEVNAEIIDLPVKEGDYVSRGQMLIQLDTIQLKKDMESSMFAANELEARLEGAQVALDQAKEEYERQQRLFDKSLTSEQVYKDAYYAFKSQETNYKALGQQVNAAESRLDKARDNLGKTTIKAPMEGTITLVDVELGEIAQAQTAFTQGRTLMVISDLSLFEVEVEIDETDIADLSFGQSAKIEIDAFPDTTFAGKVGEIGNTAITQGAGSNDQSTNFKVKVTVLDTNAKIRPGMSATVDITTNEHKGVLAVPIQAIVMRSFDPDSLKAGPEGKAADDGNVAVASTGTNASGDSTVKAGTKKKIDKKGVFVNRDGTAKFIEIQTGIADEQDFEVLSGLQDGDEVVTGSFKTLRMLKDGDKIKVNNRATSSSGGGGVRVEID
jgi:HlyD family secretion protein